MKNTESNIMKKLTENSFIDLLYSKNIFFLHHGKNNV